MMFNNSTTRLSLLSSTVFLLALGLLLLNDFWLKAVFHNGITGKLSDFAGLFVFALFFIALWPHHKKWIIGGVAGLFIFWKSPFSQPLIDSWNQTGILPVGRMVDVNDLWALLVLPLAYQYESLASRFPQVRVSPVIPLFIALFAFGATSYRCSYSVDQSYQFPLSKAELVQRISQIDTLRSMNHNQTPESVPCSYKIMCYDTSQSLPDTFSIYFPFPPMDTVYHRDSVYHLKDTVIHRSNTDYRVNGVIRALFQLRKQSDTVTQLHLFRAQGVRNSDPESCLPDSKARQEVIRYFEKFVVNDIQAPHQDDG